MDFVSLDFETANPRLCSICQVGATTFRKGKPTESFCVYVDPEDHFDDIHVSIHGINETTVSGSPSFPHIHDKLAQMLTGSIVVTHTTFDRTALQRVTAKYGLSPVDCRWLDTSRVVRRAWPQFERSGYGLGNVAAFLGHEFRHHDAGEDSRVAGLILVDAINHTGLSLDSWLDRVKSPVSGGTQADIARSGDPNGRLAGEVVVFTGALSLARREAAALAAAAGCDVGDNVCKETTLLVVGDQDVGRLSPGQSKSGKHRKAEDLAARGQPIRIVAEADFIAMIE